MQNDLDKVHQTFEGTIKEILYNQAKLVLSNNE